MQQTAGGTPSASNFLQQQTANEWRSSKLVGASVRGPVVPGMSAEVNILTGSNTVLDYLLKPVRRVAENAFRQ